MQTTNNSVARTSPLVNSATCCGEYLSVEEADLALDRAVETYSNARSRVRTGPRFLAPADAVDGYRIDAERALKALRESLVNRDMAVRNLPTIRSQVQTMMMEEPVFANALPLRKVG